MMKHLRANLTNSQIVNLEALAALLVEVPEDNFAMGSYYTFADKRMELGGARVLPQPYHPCHTVACAIGWGPAVVPPFGWEVEWAHYANRAFGASNLVYNWCFVDNWEKYDDTPVGAAKRIHYLLQHGAPYTFCYKWPPESSFRIGHVLYRDLELPHHVPRFQPAYANDLLVAA